jgi:predicted AlkP superfamily phosphohydrolase/phosphomutase/tetratricopeptide (TPR) repeat protein
MAIMRRRSESSPKRVLLIGWDAADWQMIHPLVDQGLMPTMRSLMQEGAWGNLATIRPILSPILWNTIATGKRAQQHGVYGFTEPDADGTGLLPVASTSRKCKAIWNILTQNELRSNVVGWYASHPAEPINGVMVSNRFEQFTTTDGKISAVPNGAIHPSERTEELSQFRVHPAEIDSSAILPFIPNAAELVGKEGNRLGKLQHMLAQTATIHAVATHLMAETEWHFTAVYYEGIDRFGHEFMEFHPPKMAQVSREEFDDYQHCMVGIYRFHDMLLETLLRIAGDDTAVILLSDHGYYNNHLRPDPRKGKSGPLEWHRPFGILAARGPGFRPVSRLYGASIMDIAPTVLHLLGLPAAYDMPGRVLAEVLEDSRAAERIESWEEIEGECGMHPAELRIDPAESRAMMQQLVELGYISPPSEDVEKSIRETIASNQLCLGQSQADAREFVAAIETIERLAEEPRKSLQAQLLYAFCLLGIGDGARAREILESLLREDCGEPRIHMMLGTLEFAEGSPEKALAHLAQVGDADSRLPGLHSKLGDVYLEMGRHELAVEAFEKALSIDGENPLAFAGLARAKLEIGDPKAALDNALIAAELVHHFPRVHYVIGKALVALGDYHGAVEALELCVKQAPKMAAAHKTLASVYRDMGQTGRAMEAELRAKSLMA